MTQFVQIAVSGGRTSAYMAHWMINNRPEVAEHIGCSEQDMEYIFLFANTGMEHEDTLRFLDEVDNNFLGGELIWVEAVPYPNQRKASGHRVTDFEHAYGPTDFREPDHPFHAVVRKYGLPNVKFLLCTREMKLNAMNSCMADMGIDHYHTAIGIREDENRRVSKNAGVDSIIYPLVDLNPVDKQDVLDFFEPYPWNLTIPEWQGNCVTCYKKSYKKLARVYEETPEVFLFNEFMELKYGFVGPEFKKHGVTEPRSFFRMNTTTKNLIKTFEVTGETGSYINIMNDAGCSESCEMYEMDEDGPQRNRH